MRQAIQQMMLVLPSQVQLATIMGDDVIGPRNVDQGNNDNFWETVVFSQALPVGETLSIKRAFNLLKRRVMDEYTRRPNVLILTASESLAEESDLSEEVNWVRDNMIQVDILTFVGIANSALLPIAASSFGHLYASNTGSIIF